MGKRRDCQCEYRVMWRMKGQDGETVGESDEYEWIQSYALHKHAREAE